MRLVASGGGEQQSQRSRRPAPPPQARKGRSAEQAESAGIEMYFAPPGVQIPEEESSVISAVKRHEAATHQATLQGALRRLAPAVKALSPRKQHRKNLQAIDRFENVVDASAAQRGARPEDVEAARYARRRDRETCKRLHQSSEARVEHVNQVIANRVTGRSGSVVGGAQL